MNSNLALILGYLNPALNNLAVNSTDRKYSKGFFRGFLNLYPNLAVSLHKKIKFIHKNEGKNQQP